MKSFSVFSFLFLTALTAAAQTGTNAVANRPMSLQDCIKESLTHNFDVQIERYNPQIALYILNAAYSGYDPTFNFTGQHNYNNSGPRYENGQLILGSVSEQNNFNSGFNGGTPWGMTYNLSGNVSDSNIGTNNSFGLHNNFGAISLQVTQPLLKNFWIDTTRLNIRVAKNRLKFSEQGLRLQLITSVTAVVNAYYELIFAQQNVQVQQEALNLAQTQLDQDKQRVQIGTLAILSVQQDESQLAQSQANLIAAQSTLDTAENTLKNLLTDSYSQWHDVDIQPTATLEATPQSFDLQNSWNAGLNQRPDLLQAKLNVEEQGIELKYYRNQLFPEVDLIGTYGFNGSGGLSSDYNGTFNQLGQGSSPFYSYGAALTMPLSNVGPRNQYKSTKATLQQILLQLKQLEQNVMVEIDNAVKTAQSDYESVQATRQTRVYAEAALDAEQKTYAVGKATTFEVLTYQNNLTGARSQEIRALANYDEALAALAQQEGTTLQQYHINLEPK
ncbi:MAG TPA: TolC family protein [Candidatus Acidoferrales bacterium]|nr:TolC family protein [Candidatus Acidoferrales bacterium]